MSNRSYRCLAALAVFNCALFSGVQSVSAQQEKVVAEAAEDYRLYCVACHGAEGKGDGELASKLIKPPSDLTGIAARHGGFPFWRVYAMVAGEEPVPGHDTFQMPQYAERMKADEEMPGYLPGAYPHPAADALSEKPAGGTSAAALRGSPVQGARLRTPKHLP